jgi:hypothetical protein
MRKTALFLGLFLLHGAVFRASTSADLLSKDVDADLSKADPQAAYWNAVKPEMIPLLAQPMVLLRPKTTTTPALEVQSVHNSAWIAFRLRWKDPDHSMAGILGEFSDAVALQFPVIEKEIPPLVFMGSPGDPVHIFHWRAQYQRDKEEGKPDMKQLYPHLNMDTYPMEYPDWGNLQIATEQARESFSPGKAVGNPQSYGKTGVDEIIAEGFSTSAVFDAHDADANGLWNDGEWVVVIARPLKREGGSALTVGQDSFIGFAVWQGGEGEVGSRKSVTMMWTPLKWVP